ncbi:hypothetical protein BDR26DRAFT_870484 [Obelidium mucronatum]|nr:hypothetical protein BDR26DRAFT_870484 [Obelidium mucronatum]
MVAVQEGSGVPAGSVVVVPADTIIEEEGVGGGGGGACDADGIPNVAVETSSSGDVAATTTTTTPAVADLRERVLLMSSSKRVSKRFSSLVDLTTTTPDADDSVPVISSERQPVVGEEGNDRGVCMVMYPYTATQQDELALIPGDSIMVVRRFDDGWAFGVSVQSGCRGVFPEACVEGLSG